MPLTPQPHARGRLLTAAHPLDGMAAESDSGDDRLRDVWLACADALLEQFRTDPPARLRTSVA